MRRGRFAVTSTTDPPRWLHDKSNSGERQGAGGVAEMSDHTEMRLQHIESQLEGMRGNQRDMLSDLGALERDLVETRAFRKRVLWRLDVLLGGLAIWQPILGVDHRSRSRELDFG
jgi:hypothetical protein